MAFGPNRAKQQPTAKFEVAGGTIMKFRHPFLAGHINYGTGAAAIDEIDVSACVKLATKFLEALPNQDNAIQVILVDGSVVTVTNHLLNGTLTLPVIRGSGLVGRGDFIAALQLVVSSQDSVGGTFEVQEQIGDTVLTTLFYGVAVGNVPHLIKVGNDVPEYPVKLLYAGFVQALSKTSTGNKRAIWAVGNDYGLEGIYKPYGINDIGSTGDGPISTTNTTPHQIQDGLTDAENFTNKTAAGAAVAATYPNFAGTASLNVNAAVTGSTSPKPPVPSATT
jgi:hypothetical protein